jgi:hypothetical protein
LDGVTKGVLRFSRDAVFLLFFSLFFLMQRCFLVLHCTAFGCSGVLS